MFHKIKNISALPDFKLSVQFCEGVTKLYDLKPLFEKLSCFPLLAIIHAKGVLAIVVKVYLFIKDLLPLPGQCLFCLYPFHSVYAIGANLISIIAQEVMVLI